MSNDIKINKMVIDNVLAPNESEVLEKDWTLEHMSAHIIQAQDQIFRGKEVFTKIEDDTIIVTIYGGADIKLVKDGGLWNLRIKEAGLGFYRRLGLESMPAVKHVMLIAMGRRMELYEMQNCECSA